MVAVDMAAVEDMAAATAVAGIRSTVVATHSLMAAARLFRVEVVRSPVAARRFREGPARHFREAVVRPFRVRLVLRFREAPLPQLLEVARHSLPEAVPRRFREVRPTFREA